MQQSGRKQCTTCKIWICPGNTKQATDKSFIMKPAYCRKKTKQAPDEVKCKTLYATARELVASWIMKRRDWASTFNASKRRTAMSILSLRQGRMEITFFYHIK